MAKDLETNTEITPIKISTFLNTDVKDYARYCVETRACPKLADGLRSGARKIVYAALNGDLKNKNKVKCLALVGDTMKLEYHHGDTSLYNTIVQLSSDYINKYKPLDIIGQIGYIRQTDIDVAPRYLSVSKSKYIEMFNTDKELWQEQFEDGSKIEPKSFYPIVPNILLYRTNSPGYGFSYRAFSYTLDSVIMNCIEALTTGQCSGDNRLKPEIDGYDNNNFVYSYSRKSWYSVGSYTVDFDDCCLIIEDLPYNVQYEQYDDHLTELKDKLIIKSFKNLSTGGNVRYVIKFQVGALERLYRDKWKFYKTFRLFKKIPADIYNVISDNNNIVHYEDGYHLIEAFVKNRLKIYQKRKTNTIDYLQNEIQRLSDIIKFIYLYIDGTIIVNKRPIEDIRRDLVKHQLSESVLKISISKLTKEEIEKHEKEIQELKNYLKYIQETSIEKMYLIELIKLRKEFIGDAQDMTKL